MISCPAAWGMRWVNPSMATVSPSRTLVFTASARVVMCGIVRARRRFRRLFRKHSRGRSNAKTCATKLTAMPSGRTMANHSPGTGTARMGFRGIWLGLAVLLCGTGSAAAQQQDKIVELKLSHWMPATHPLQKAMEDWAAGVEQMSNGSILYKIAPAEQLGKAAEQYELVRSGLADVAFVEPANQLAKFPIVAAAALPLLVANAKGGSAALDEWYRPYAAKEMSEVKFCFAFVTEPGTLHSRSKKFLLPKDLRQVKVHPPNTLISTFIGRLGAITAPGPETDVRAALENGDTEATISPWDSLPIFGIDRLTRY